jgi:predicted SprT family Zn-dependent metalloprotease
VLYRDKIINYYALMRVYNQQILVFLKKITILTKVILKDEMSADVRSTRFLFNKYLYPIKLVCFEHPTKLGEFDPSNYTISINRIFMTTNTKDLEDVLRHELAHYMAYLKFGIEALNHGEQFKLICKSYGWGRDVSSATMNIENIELKEYSSKFETKVKKLLSLAENTNEHESKLATAKANQLMFKHGINEIGNFEEDICVKEILNFKKRNNKHMAIYEILSQFYVKPVFSHSKGLGSIEVTGSRSSVELAHYVSDYLTQELERLWEKEKLSSDLKGLRAKNSFFSGISKGYLEKIKDVQSEIIAEDPKALIRIEKDLQIKVKMAYQRLSSVNSKAKTSKDAFKSGLMAGKSLTIKKGLKNKVKTLFLGN